MKKTFILKKNYEFKNTLKKGKAFYSKNVVCYYLKNNKKENFLGIAISSKLFNAVKRNKGKRLIREAYKQIENNITTGNTFVFILKKDIDIKKCTSNILKDDMIEIFNKIGIYNNEKNFNSNN